MKSTESLLFENTSDAVICLDHSGTVESVNPAAELLLRIKMADVRGHDFWESFPQARTAVAQDMLRDALSGKRALKFDLFFPLRYIWVSILAIPSATGAVLFMRDISDRVRLMHTEAIQEGVRAIIEVAPVAISVTQGAEHRTTMINAKARELIGDREVVGIPARTAFPELEGQGLFELLDEVWTTGQSYSGAEVPVSYRPSNSAELRDAFFDVSYQPLLDSGGAIYAILSVSVDVTAQVDARRRLEALVSGS